MDDLSQLTVVTVGAALGSVVVSKSATGALYYVFGGASKSFEQFFEAAAAAFILVICTFEKMLPFLAGSQVTYYVMTFFFGIAFSRIFLSFSPSPCTPLMTHWKKIRRAALYGKNKRRISLAVGVPEAIYVFLKVSIPSLLGLVFGYVIALKCLASMWDGYMTSHHINNLPILNTCLLSLNTDIFTGFCVEFFVTLSLLQGFGLMDEMLPKKMYFLLNSTIKSLIVCGVLYLLIDVTGAYSNPFLAYVVQRHCLTDCSRIFEHVVVYGVAPMLATLIHLILNDFDQKKKQ